MTEAIAGKMKTLLEATTVEDAKIIVWKMIQKGLARRLDYDTRMCPARALID